MESFGVLDVLQELFVLGLDKVHGVTAAAAVRRAWWYDVG